ncbi:hypothetical protein RI129_000287 [Pyrocoelia pectoralis]|uniref:Uncharacterized protein n=1 Tax=Pyrocoelia pectoralis TaxID=417401 RepID=A0AAN7VTW1_9COLE
MNVISSKILAAVIIGVTSLLLGLLPACFALQRQRNWTLCLSSLLCFGGGVLMSTSLIHMLPEIRRDLPEYEQHYAEIIFCIGFFIVYVLDEMVHFFYGDAHSHPSSAVMNTCKKPSYGSVDSKESQGGCSHHTEEQSLEVDVINCDDHPPSQLCHVGHQEPCNASPIGNLGLLVALCVHSILEGLAIGLQSSSAQVLLLLGAVSSHKLVVSFCLGVEIASNSQSFLSHFISITIFSTGSVIGIVIGMGVTQIPEGISSFVFPVLQGLAAGTLLYVTVSEVIPRERARWHKQHRHRIAGICQLLSVIVGFTVMSIFTLWLTHEDFEENITQQP